MPPQHAGSAGLHVVVHAPQLFASVCVFTQTPLQPVNPEEQQIPPVQDNPLWQLIAPTQGPPAGDWHDPEPHVAPAGHALHDPQWFGSVFELTQTPPPQSR